MDISREYGFRPSIETAALYNQEFYPYTNTGRIVGRNGCMGSGKSAWLIDRIRSYKGAGRRVLGFKSEIDTRDKGIASRNGGTFPCIACKRLMDHLPRVLNEDVQVVAIDEAHWLPDLYEFCTLLARLGKVVIVAYLDGTFMGRVWENVVRLIPEFDENIKLTGPCYKCPYGLDERAIFTVRVCTNQEEVDQYYNGGDASATTETAVEEENDQIPKIGDLISASTEDMTAFEPLVITVGDQDDVASVPVLEKVEPKYTYIEVCRRCRHDRDPKHF